MAEYEGGNESTAVPMHSDGKNAKLRFCFLPHKCDISGKWLWMTTAYRIREKYYSVDYTNPEHKITYTWWVDKHTYIMEKLKA